MCGPIYYQYQDCGHHINSGQLERCQEAYQSNNVCSQEQFQQQPVVQYRPGLCPACTQAQSAPYNTLAEEIETADDVSDSSEDDSDDMTTNHPSEVSRSQSHSRSKSKASSALSQATSRRTRSSRSDGKGSILSDESGNTHSRLSRAYPASGSRSETTRYSHKAPAVAQQSPPYPHADVQHLANDAGARNLPMGQTPQYQPPGPSPQLYDSQQQRPSYPDHQYQQPLGAPPQPQQRYYAQETIPLEPPRDTRSRDEAQTVPANTHTAYGYPAAAYNTISIGRTQDHGMPHENAPYLHPNQYPGHYPNSRFGGRRDVDSELSQHDLAANGIDPKIRRHTDISSNISRDDSILRRRRAYPRIPMPILEDNQLRRARHRAERAEDRLFEQDTRRAIRNSQSDVDSAAESDLVRKAMLASLNDYTTGLEQQMSGHLVTIIFTFCEHEVSRHSSECAEGDATPATVYENRLCDHCLLKMQEEQARVPEIRVQSPSSSSGSMDRRSHHQDRHSLAPSQTHSRSSRRSSRRHREDRPLSQASSSQHSSSKDHAANDYTRPSDAPPSRPYTGSDHRPGLRVVNEHIYEPSESPSFPVYGGRPAMSFHSPQRSHVDLKAIPEIPEPTPSIAGSEAVSLNDAHQNRAREEAVRDRLFEEHMKAAQEASELNFVTEQSSKNPAAANVE